MEAQVAACRIGAERFLELIERYGLETVQGGERGPDGLLRAACSGARSRSSPTARYEAEGFIDGFLDHPDPRYRDLRDQGRPSRSTGSDIHVDLTGTSPQIDLPINMPFEGTVDIAIYLTLRSILLDSGPPRARADELRALPADHDHRARGLPREPALPGADDRALLPGQHRRRHGDARARAGRAGRTSAPASATSRSSPTPGFRGGGSTGSTWTSRRAATAAGCGKDGLDAVDTLYANTRNNPIEDIESHFPLRVTRYELHEDTRRRRALARRPRHDPRDRVPRARRAARSRATARCTRRPGSSAATTGRPGAVVLNRAATDGAASCRRSSRTARPRPATGSA